MLTGKLIVFVNVFLTVCPVVQEMKERACEEEKLERQTNGSIEGELTKFT